MSEGRSTRQRKADVLAALDRNGDLWLATASAEGQPHLIAASAWWDGSQLTMATTAGSVTARNLEASKTARIGLGATDDVVMIDAVVAESTMVSTAKPELKSGFKAAVGWDPAEEGSDWKFFRLRPVRIQAYRGYGEVQGRDVMRDSRWLA
jgi:hypothetical protein